MANASDLGCYFDYFSKRACGGDVTSQALAHAYGDLSLTSECGPYSDISDVLKYKNNYGYYCKRTHHHQEFAYRFNEYNPTDNQKVYPRLTNRTITASSGDCLEYPMVGDYTTLDTGDLLYKYKNDTYNGNITIPAQSGSYDGTTWVYRDTKIPQKADEYACGPRCIKMWAHKAGGHGENSTFYECPITVNLVSNSLNDKQDVSDDMARLAAASIALQGRPSGIVNNENIWTQYQLYAFGSAYETHFKEADEVGADMAEFAIGSLSTMAYRNPQINLPGLIPYLGSRLKVHWYYIIPLLAGIAGVHLALFGSAVYLTTTYKT